MEEAPWAATGESPRLSGRAVVALWSAPDLAERNAKAWRVADLARDSGLVEFDDSGH